MLNMAEEWRKQDKTRHAPGDEAEWDARSASYGARHAHHEYIDAFIQKMGLEGGERILDMGCGPGTLAIPLAQLGHAVVAADFSAGMLEQLRMQAARMGVALAERPLGEFLQGGHGACGGASGDAGDVRGERRGTAAATGAICPVHMSWEDEWERFGLGRDSVDVALASRAIITHDLEDSLAKLSRVARRRVCVTAATGVSPRVDPQVARVMGLVPERRNDALFVFGVACELGFEPEVSYMHSPRTKVYPNRAEAYHSLMKIIDYVQDAPRQVDVDAASCKLNAWLDAHLVECEDGVCLDTPRDVPWAFISWEV